MAARIIWFDRLYDDPKYWSLPPATRDLFLGIWGAADDCGLLPLSYPFIRRHCVNPFRPPSAAKCAAQIDEIKAVDYLRTYEIGTGKLAARYGFIPNFGQRLRQTVIRWPIPPAHIYADDKHAVEIFQKIITLSKNLPADCPQHADIPPPEGSEGREFEGKKRSNGEEPAPIAGRAAAIAVFLRNLEKARGKAPQITSADPRVVAWADAGVSDAQLQEAHRMAVDDRDAKGDTKPVNAGFIDIFVQKLRNPRTPAARQPGNASLLDWWTTDAGWIAKATELGIEVQVGPGFVGMQARICKRLGPGSWQNERDGTLMRLIDELTEAA